jgi:hypothetical protein
MSASLCPFSESLAMNWNRREFLAAGGALALALSAGPLEGAPNKRKNQQVLYRYARTTRVARRKSVLREPAV